MTARFTRIRLALVAGLLLALPAAHAADSVEASLAKVIRKAVPAFVFIAHGKGSGSGAVISSDGLVVTNQHVIKDEEETHVRLGNGESYEAKILGRDRQGDLALLKIDANRPLPYLRMGDSDKLHVGDLCVAIGNPLALGVIDQTPTVTQGVISGLHQFKGGGKYNDAIVTDAPINPGNSGGPLLNMRGELIGVNGLVETRLGLRSNSGLGYAIPINQVKLWLPHLRDPDRVDVYRGRMTGIVFETEAGKHTGQGALIREVKPDSDADKAGLKAGDVITVAQGLPVWSAVRFAGILNTLPAGTTLYMIVKRGEAVRRLSYELPERRPADFGFTLKKPKKNEKVLVVADVQAGSPEAEAGLQPGDEIVAIGGNPLSGAAVIQYLAVVQRWMPRIVTGSKVTLTVRRTVNGEPQEKEITYEVN